MKTKERPIGKAVDDTMEIVNDFICQTPFWNYQVSEYRNYEPFENLTPILEDHLERLFEGELDAGNADVLDCLIADYAREAVKHLKRQHIHHRNALKEFYIQREGARKAFEEFLISLETLYSQLEAERDNLLIRYADDKFEGGKEYEM